MKTNLTDHFTLEEFQSSYMAARYGLKNQAPRFAIDNMKQLCSKVLEPARAALKYPIYLNSGYRSQKLNSLVGGVDNSLHCYGRAADIRPSRPELLDDLFEILSKLPHTELILYKEKQFIHVAL